jgi:hypothetical protein
MSLFICMLGQSNYFYQLLSEVLLVFWSHIHSGLAVALWFSV